MSSHVKNFTFSLPIEVIDSLREYAKNHYISSVNAGVKEAIEEYTRKLEKEKLKKEMQEALLDSTFLSDLQDSMRDFETSDAEMAVRTKEW